jgi:hypothetical protein
VEVLGPETVEVALQKFPGPTDTSARHKLIVQMNRKRELLPPPGVNRIEIYDLQGKLLYRTNTLKQYEQSNIVLPQAINVLRMPGNH